MFIQTHHSSQINIGQWDDARAGATGSLFDMSDINRRRPISANDFRWLHHAPLPSTSSHTPCLYLWYMLVCMLGISPSLLSAFIWKTERKQFISRKIAKAGSGVWELSNNISLFIIMFSTVCPHHRTWRLRILFTPNDDICHRPVSWLFEMEI